MHIVHDLPVEAAQRLVEPWIRRSARELDLAGRTELDGAGDLPHIGLKLTVNSLLDMTLEKDDETEAGNGQRASSRQQRHRQEAQAKRPPAHSLGSGVI